MRKALLVSAGILLLAIGGVIGWLVGTRGRGTDGMVAGGDGSVRPGNPAAETAVLVTRYRVGDPAVLAPPPSREEWYYPNSQIHKAASSGKFALGNIEGASVDRVALLSPDDFDNVWAFYRDKVEQQVLADGRRASAASGQEGAGDKKVSTVTIYDRHYACDIAGPESDLFRTKGFWVQSRRFKLAGFISRAKVSKSTEILLFYRPDSEFIGLLKEVSAKE